MYRLYWHPSASSLAPMAVLEELGVPFDLHQVDYDGGENRTPGYLRLQPLGLIPALEFEDGGSMFESAAIVLYLCDRHRRPELAPSCKAAARPRYLQWLLFMADTNYPSYNRYYWPGRYTTGAEGAAEVKEQAHNHADPVAGGRGRPAAGRSLAAGAALLGLRHLSADDDHLAPDPRRPSRRLARRPGTGARRCGARRLPTRTPTAQLRNRPRDHGGGVRHGQDREDDHSWPGLNG